MALAIVVDAATIAARSAILAENSIEEIPVPSREPASAPVKSGVEPRSANPG